ncbi:MAG: metal-dependent phosphohydrolase [Actinomycetes bacterium]
MDEHAVVEAARLRARYREPHRHYHDLRHVESVLAMVDELADSQALSDDDRCVVRLAAWFHDAVYDPRASDNEHRSAELARQTLSGVGAATEAADEVARLVIVTTEHVVEAGDVRAAVLCDADLSILGSAADRYADYVRGVRAEYAFVDDAGFRKGRAAVLRRLLAREHVFATSDARQRWEQAARVQVAHEISLLETVPSTRSNEGEAAARAVGTSDPGP